MTITRSRSQVMIVVAWLSGITLALPYVLLCSIPPHTELQKNLHILFTLIQTTLGYILPFIGLCWLYIRMSIESHKNCLRTRKHSISGELLTVMDGSTSVIPQGIDFLTHYINPFTRTPMAGSVAMGPGHRNSIGQIVPVAKKTRRRSSNGSSSSLLFREEGRAIKTAFFVLASFFICWTPHFALMLMNEVSESKQSFEQVLVYDNNTTLMEMDGSVSSVSGDSFRNPYQQQQQYSHQQHHSLNPTSSSPFYSVAGKSCNWAKFLSVFGMLLSSVLNPFIYVFRNKLACEEISRLIYGLFGIRLMTKGDEQQQYSNHNHNHNSHNHTVRDKDRKPPPDPGYSNGTNGLANPILGMNDPGNLYDKSSQDLSDYQPRYTPCIGKSPKRSSMKSLTPQSSINSTMTNCNSMNGNSNESPVTGASLGKAGDVNGTHVSFCNGRGGPAGAAKPPFVRSLTVPEQQTQPRVKFPPNLTRQKSYASYRPPQQPYHNHLPTTNAVVTIASGIRTGTSSESTPATSKRAKFVRQDSVCSILSNDSVLMICSEDGIPELAPLGILNMSLPSSAVHLPQQSYPRGSTTISRVPESDNEDEPAYAGQMNSCGGSIQGTPSSKCYLRQDSNFSNRTNDSGIALSSICSNSTRLSNSLSTSVSHSNTPEHNIMNSRKQQVSPQKSPAREQNYYPKSQSPSPSSQQQQQHHHNNQLYNGSFKPDMSPVSLGQSHHNNHNHHNHHHPHHHHSHFSPQQQADSPRILHNNHSPAVDSGNSGASRHGSPILLQTSI